MNRRSTLRVPIALAVSVVAVVATTATPVAAFDEYSAWGTREYYEVPADYYPNGGVVCGFENNHGERDDELQSLTVRKFGPVHGVASAPDKAYVARRLVFERNQAPHSDGVFEVYRRTPWAMKLADDNENPVYFGPYTFAAPENTGARWRAKLFLRWFDVNGNLIGEARGLLEVYRHKPPDSSSAYTIGMEGDPGHCRKEFH